MNFPHSPLFNFLYWLINTAGLGSVIVGLIAAISIVSYGLTLRWISRGAQADEAEEYAYPTPTLHGHH